MSEWKGKFSFLDLMRTTCFILGLEMSYSLLVSNCCLFPSFPGTPVTFSASSLEINFKGNKTLWERVLLGRRCPGGGGGGVLDPCLGIGVPLGF